MSAYILFLYPVHNENAVNISQHGIELSTSSMVLRHVSYEVTGLQGNDTYIFYI